MLQIVAERVREARTDGFEPGCLAALLRMEGPFTIRISSRHRIVGRCFLVLRSNA